MMMEKVESEQGKNMILTRNNVKFETMRSGGPGGQNVNRRATAVRLRVNIESLPISAEEKDFVRSFMPERHLIGDEIVVENSETRSQEQNKDRALEIANDKLEEALRIGRAPIRRPIKPGGGAKKKRAEREQKEGAKRQMRSERTGDFLDQAFDEDPDLEKRLSGE